MKPLNMKSHKDKEFNIKLALLAIILTVVLVSNWSCTALKDPCHERRGMIGYGYKAR